MCTLIIRTDGSHSVFDRTDNSSLIAMMIGAKYIELLPLRNDLKGWEAYIDENGKEKLQAWEAYAKGKPVTRDQLAKDGKKQPWNNIVSFLMNYEDVKYYYSTGGVIGDVAVLIPKGTTKDQILKAFRCTADPSCEFLDFLQPLRSANFDTSEVPSKKNT